MRIEYKRDKSKTVEMTRVVLICHPQRTALAVSVSRICTAETVEQSSRTSGPSGAQDAASSDCRAILL